MTKKPTTTGAEIKHLIAIRMSGGDIEPECKKTAPDDGGPVSRLAPPHRRRANFSAGDLPGAPLPAQPPVPGR